MSGHHSPRASALLATLLGLAGAVAALSGHVADLTLLNEEVGHAFVQDVTVLDSTLQDATIVEAFIEGSSLERVTLQRATVQDSLLRDALVEQALLRDARIEDSELRDVTVQGGELAEVRLERALVRDATLRDATVVDAVLERVELQRVSLCRVLLFETMTFVNDGCGPGPEWPREGSFVRFVAQQGTGPIVGGGGFAGLSTSLLDLTFHDGAWSGTCRTMTQQVVDHEAGTTLELQDFDATYVLTAQGGGTLVFGDDGDGNFDGDEAVYYQPELRTAVAGNDVRIANTGSFAPGSQVRASHSDFDNPTTAMPGGLAFFDSNADGFFSSGDTLSWDTDGSGTVTVNDIVLSGTNAGTIVTSSTPGLNNALAAAPGGATFAFFDANGDTVYNSGDIVYWDADGSGTATVHDVRLMPLGSEAFGSTVEVQDFDTTFALTIQGAGTLVFVDDDGDGVADIDVDEPVYYAPAGPGATIVGNDVRIANTGPFDAGSQVRASHSDFGIEGVLGMPGGLAFFDSDGDGFFSTGDILFWDTDGSGTVTVRDLFLSGSHAGTVMGSTTPGLNKALAPAPGGANFAFFDANADTVYNAGDTVYWDADGSGSGTVQDVRLGGIGDKAFGSILGPRDFDTTYILMSLGAATLVFVDDDGDGDFDSDEPAYLAPAGGASTVVGNDVRIANTGAFGEGSQVRASHSDFGNPTTALPGGLGFFDSNGDGFFSVGDILFWDTDGSSTVTIRDIVLSGAQAGIVVSSSTPGLTNALAAPPGGATFAFFDAGADTVYNREDAVYWDADGSSMASVADVRLMPFQEEETTRSEVTTDREPLLLPVDTAPGEQVTVERSFSCAAGAEVEPLTPVEPLIVVEVVRKPFDLEPSLTNVRAWHGVAPPTDPSRSHEVFWDTNTGLLLQWSFCIGTVGGCSTGHLVATDAPLAV